MTTEIAIINRHAVALAADSAVTIGRQRVWKTANKLFSLGPNNDIAVMTFNLGEFISFPWETIIKTFRQKTGSHRFQTLKECTESLLDYLRSSEISNPAAEDISILLLFKAEIDRLKSRVTNYKTKAEFKTRLATAITLAEKRVQAQKELCLPDATLSDFKKTFSQSIVTLAKDTLKENLNRDTCNRIVDLCFEAYRRTISSQNDTGLVVAGYGATEYFPSVATCIVDGKHGGTLRAWPDPSHSHDLNDPSQSEGVIIPFAQDDVISLFFQGIAAAHLRWIRKTLNTILTDKSKTLVDAFVTNTARKVTELAQQESANELILKEFFSEFQTYRDDTVIQKIMEVVASLPKEEMAAMAEALVELTSLRRKVDSPLETVGGPTDVALISKGDGLIWIKRKHYFSMELNGDFRRRKDGQVKGAWQ